MIPATHITLSMALMHLKKVLILVRMEDYTTVEEGAHLMSALTEPT